MDTFFARPLSVLESNVISCAFNPHPFSESAHEVIKTLLIIILSSGEPVNSSKLRISPL